MTTGLSLGSPVTDNVTDWATNALKQIERWARTLASGTMAYNNTSSGLDAINAQDAIDEVLSSLTAVIAALAAATQPLDATLTALAALDTSQGFVYQNGTDAFTKLGLKGYLFGLTLSNNTGDATNDIDIAAGAAADASGLIMTLASALGKRLDAAWAVGGTPGTTVGGLDTGSIANGTYHVWLIQRSDTGVVDALFSASASAPTMPTSYDRKRRIGSILREGAVIVPFIQTDDTFLRSIPINDVSTTNPGTSAVTATLSVPVGIVVDARFSSVLQDDTPATGNSVLFTALAQANTAVTVNQCDLSYHATGATVPNRASGDIVRPTNTAAAIRYRMQVSNADVSIQIITHGWTDQRGRIS